MKSRTNIETAKPAAASQSRPERRASPTSHAVTGSQTSEREERERVGAVAVVDEPGVEEQGREPVAEDAVGAGAVADRVAPERARVGDEERQEARRRAPRRRRRRADERLPRQLAREQHDDEERHGDEGELLQQDRGGERDGGPDVARARQQREREQERSKPVASAVPNQAPRTSSGLAARAAPIASAPGAARRRASTAKKQPIVASRTRSR